MPSSFLDVRRSLTHKHKIGLMHRSVQRVKCVESEMRESYRVFTRSSKRPALRLLEVCWTFAGSCKHPIRPI